MLSHYLKVHEVSEFGDWWVKYFYNLLVNFNSVLLLIALHLKQGLQ